MAQDVDDSYYRASTHPGAAILLRNVAIGAFGGATFSRAKNWAGPHGGARKSRAPGVKRGPTGAPQFLGPAARKGCPIPACNKTAPSDHINNEATAPRPCRAAGGQMSPRRNAARQLGCRCDKRKPPQIVRSAVHGTMVGSAEPGSMSQLEGGRAGAAN